MDFTTKLGQQLAQSAEANDLQRSRDGTELVSTRTKARYGMTTHGRIYQSRPGSQGKEALYFADATGDTFEPGSLQGSAGEQKRREPFTVAQLFHNRPMSASTKNSQTRPSGLTDDSESQKYLRTANEMGLPSSGPSGDMFDDPRFN
ncbi:MAG: hypothetical protein EOO38_20940 [Cytophagaceae bacterium]|nr:MAG: hypothetical protein EOO38_20940 [Cytophagaceae bacterium]